MAWKHFEPYAELENVTTSSTFYIRRVRYQDTISQEVLEKTRLCFCIGHEFNPKGSGMHTPQHPIALWLSYIDGTAYTSTTIYQLVNGSDSSTGLGQKYVTDRNLTLQASAVSEQYPIVWMEAQGSATVANPEVISNYVTNVRDAIDEDLRLSLFKLYNPSGRPVFDTWEDAVGYLYTDDPEGYIDEHDIYSDNFRTDWKCYLSYVDKPNITMIASTPRWSESSSGFRDNSEIKMEFVAQCYIAGSPIFDHEFTFDSSYNSMSTSYTKLFEDAGNEFPFSRGRIVLNCRVTVTSYTSDEGTKTVSSKWASVEIQKTDNTDMPQRIVAADGSTMEIIIGQPSEDEIYVDPDNPTPPEPNDPDPDINLSGFGVAQYELTNSEMRQLLGFMWSDGFLDNIKKFNQDPSSNIISILAIPQALPFDQTETRHIVIGNIDTGISSRKLAGKNWFDIGSVDVEPMYNNFLDKKCTGIMLYLPYIGMCPISAEICMGKRLKVRYYIDTINGNCEAFVFVDGVSTYKFSGQFGFEIPISSSNFSGIWKNAIAGAGNIATGAISGGWVGAGIAAISSAVSLATTQIPSGQQGTISGLCATAEPQRAMLIYDRPTSQESSEYRHTHGRPCQLAKNLSNLKGYTRLAKADLSGFNITKSESDKLKSILESGFYL